MSRSSDPTAWPALRHRLGAMGLASVIVVGSPLGAMAVELSEAGEGRPIRITAPKEMGHPVSWPTVDLTSGGVALTSVSEDLAGTAQVAEASETVDVVLDGNVLFGKDSAVIRPAAQKRLGEVVALLQERSPGIVRIVGHTDDLGSAEHGLVLSRQRAQAVRRVLEPALDGFRITSEGKGEAEPRLPNTDEESRALNRRVEIHFEQMPG